MSRQPIQTFSKMRGYDEPETHEQRLLRLQTKQPMRRWVLTQAEKFHAWAAPKEALQEEIKGLRHRIHAMQAERTEALSNALLFENSDITRWLQQIAASDTGKLGVRILELEAENKALQGPASKQRESEAKAWATVDKVLEAWEIASGLRGWGRWDAKTEKWIVDRHEETLPAKVVEALKEWLVSQRPKPRS